MFNSTDHAIGFLRNSPPTRVKPLSLEREFSGSRIDREEIAWLWSITLICLKNTIRKAHGLNAGRVKAQAFALYYLQPNAFLSTQAMAKTLHLTEKRFFRYLAEVKDIFETELRKKQLLRKDED